MKTRLLLEDFVNRSNIIHNNIYDYSKVIYTNAHNKVIIGCKIHGDFEQNPNNHLFNKRGCAKCSVIERSKSNTLNTEDFIIRSNNTHDYKYDYSKSIYIKAIEKIEIICCKHGSFWQRAIHHSAGDGCPRCRVRIKEGKWLDYFNIPNDKDHRQVRIKFDQRHIVVDGYDPATNTIYEFYGDYWHGNPEVYNPLDINVDTETLFGELYLKTLDREKLILNNNYKLITAWENEFVKKGGNKRKI